MVEGKDVKKSNWLPFVVVVIAAIVLIFASGGDKNDSENHDEETNVTTEEGASSEAMIEDKVLAGLDGKKKLVIAEDFESWTEDAALSNDRVVSKALSVSGDVSEALLYVDASVQGKELTEFHSVYFKLVNSGGHLFRPDTLGVDSGDGTTLLYDLKELPYLSSVPYSEDRVPEVMDLTTLLADGTHPLVTAFISSLELGEFHEISIHYSCAADSDCSVSLR